MYNTVWLRSLFSILVHYPNPVAYFDNASTTQKPSIVLDIFNFIHFKVCANLGRGRYYLSSKLESLYASARRGILRNVRASANAECIVYKSATEALNSVCLGLTLNSSFNTLISVAEHHSGLMPWLLAERIWGVNVGVIRLGCDCIPSVRHYLELMRAGVSLVLISHMSNVLGVLVPVKLYVNVCKHRRAISIIDGAQAAAHFQLNLNRYACTSYILTAHKMYGPAGVGVNVGQRQLLSELLPTIVGGGGVDAVSLRPRAYALASLPSRLEAGSPMSFGLISLGVLMRWRRKLSSEHEKCIARYLWCRLFKTAHVSLVSGYLPSVRVLSFEFGLAHADSVCYFLNKFCVCIRSGAHCAMPLLRYLGKKSVCRVSIAIYNVYKDADMLLLGLAYLSALV
ncbi:MAG: aminotransferase class V-fold PLP-dependent enzyme [Candidatus Hodgkinia cicadicola]